LGGGTLAALGAGGGVVEDEADEAADPVAEVEGVETDADVEVAAVLLVLELSQAEKARIVARLRMKDRPAACPSW
jgi:hypothetical protein